VRPRRGEPERLGALVPRVLSELGLEASARAFRLAERWGEAVGEEVARKPELLAALRETCGEDAPGDLRLRVGELR